MAFTTQDLLNSIQRRSFAPANQQTFSTEEILAVADEVVQNDIVPAIMSVREEYFVTFLDVPVQAGRQVYSIPDRAIGLSTRRVALVSSDGSVRQLVRIEPEDISSTSRQSTPNSYYILGNDLYLNPIPNTTDLTLRVYFFMAPGRFVMPSDAAVVSSISSNQVTVNAIPSTWSTGQVFDFVKGRGGQEYIGIDEEAADITGNTLTFNNLPAGLAVGDFVTIQETSPLVQLPKEARVLLAQLTATQMLMSMGAPGGAEALKKSDAMIEAFQKLISPRSQGEPRVLQNPWRI